MPDPVKYMKYTLEKKDDSYILTAIEPDEKAPQVKVAASSSESSMADGSASSETGDSSAAESVGAQSEAA